MSLFASFVISDPDHPDYEKFDLIHNPVCDACYLVEDCQRGIKGFRDGLTKWTDDGRVDLCPNCIGLQDTKPLMPAVASPVWGALKRAIDRFVNRYRRSKYAS